MTYNEQTGEREYKPVLKTTSRITQRICILEFAGGKTLEVTPEHRFFCGGEWIPVENLETGDVLQTKNSEYLVIENKTIIATFVEVFNIEVQDNENYFVTEDGILVHNGYQKSRLPKSNGQWIEGIPGNGLWKSDLPEVNAITGGKPIPFKDGRPNFSAWKVGDDIKVKGMTGADSDFGKIYDQMKDDLGFKTKTEVQEWLKKQELTLHHYDNETIQLIPSDLHGNVPHKGSASDLRELNGI